MRIFGGGEPHAPKHVAFRHAKPDATWLRWVREGLLVLLLALIISTLLRQFVIQVYSIPSESMVPTLNVGDRILVNRIPGSGKNVERGDVVVFEDSQGWMSALPEEDQSFFRPVGEFLGIVPGDGRQIIVKRVIGVGGDTVTCCSPEGQLEVNGVPLDEEYAGATSADFSVVVPDGSYWVMGDNRANSADSLYHYRAGDTPFVSHEDVVGRVSSVIWPFTHWSAVARREVFDAVPNP